MNFTLSLAVLKHQVNKRGFFLKVFSGGLYLAIFGVFGGGLISLVTLIYRYSYLILLGIVVGYGNLRSFQRSQVNLSVTGETRYHVSIVEVLRRNLSSCRISSKT